MHIDVILLTLEIRVYTSSASTHTTNVDTIHPPDPAAGIIGFGTKYQKVQDPLVDEWQSDKYQDGRTSTALQLELFDTLCVLGLTQGTKRREPSGPAEFGVVCLFLPPLLSSSLFNASPFYDLDTPSIRDHFARPSSDFYDIDALATPKFSPSSERTGGKHSAPPNSMQGDASNRNIPARDRARPDNRRRQSNPGIPTGRSSGFQPQGYVTTPPIGPPNDGSVYSGPSLHYGPTSGYSQNAGFFGQYTVPTQPPMAVAQSPPYAYTHGFHPSGGPDTNVVRHDMQSSYQPMVSQYHYPRPQDDGASSNTLISGTNPSGGSRYPSHPPPMNTAHTSPGQSYMSSGHFPYSPAMGNPQYTYSPQFPPSPPVYNPYPPIQYPRHASSPREETQGTWYYLSHGTAPPPQYHRYDGNHYQTAYTPPYPPLTHHPEPGSFVSPAPASGGHTPLQSPQALGHPTAHQAGPSSSAVSPSAEVSSGPSPTSRPSSSGSRPVARREWHPKPPPDRSPWVMWVGNVPSDATQEELWKVFNSSPADPSSDPIPLGEVVSIFLIARSNCAFINYSSQQSLEAALKAFNGKRLRASDPQCPMLVCKVRRSSDDLKSGVGGQRGMGLHRQWVKEQRKLQSQRQGMGDASVSDDASISSRNALDHLADGSMSYSTRDPELRPKRTQGSSSSESRSSTTSSFLGEHFPTRYFILKSLSENDLELSVQSELWATQKHNELVLDRAFRTATDVFLIFSVNKSGEFYGYARMAGPIRQGEGSVSWSSLSGSPTTSLLAPPSKLLSAGQPVYLSPEVIGDLTAHSIDSSAAWPNDQPLQHLSAPANLEGPNDRPVRSPSLKFSLDQHRRRLKTQRAEHSSFRLDPEAPLRAMNERSGEGARGERGAKGKSSLGSVKEGGEEGIDGIGDGPTKPSPLWGDCFKVEWIERRKVPFHRTRHLRNAWNKGREIKVSRDGTELESSVGQRLLEEWESLAESS